MREKIIEMVAQGVETLAVVVILGGIIYAIIRYFLHRKEQVGDAYRLFKQRVGKTLLLGLEFLVAADIIETVTVRPTQEGITLLGVLVLIRTLLSWSLVVEIEGRWPWQGKGDAETR
jgi:uncharacterized membrane protein